MGCLCSRPTEEIAGFSSMPNSTWAICCFRSCCFLNAKCNISCPPAPKHEASLSVHSTSTISHHNDQCRYAETEASTISGGHGCSIEVMDSNNIRCIESNCGEKDDTPLPKERHNSTWIVDSISMQEDCPICLEEYSAEDPRIDTLCEHHFHLACILEWMERSNNCPMCNEEMEFDGSRCQV